MKKKLFLLLLVFAAFCKNGFSQDSLRTNCCDVPACREQTESYAVRIAGIILFIAPYDLNNNAKNEQYLDSLKKANPALYNNFVQTINEILDFQETSENNLDRGPCFKDKLPADVRVNVLAWKAFFGLKRHKTIFPSTEFCHGWKRRVEINQGATNIFTKNATYLGSIHAFIMYNFPVRDKITNEKLNCGGKIRLMAGPAGYVRGNSSYLTLSSRIAYRVADIGKAPFSLGNLNAFGGYITSFSGFDYATAGLEAELGPFALNLAANFDTRKGYWGFDVGLVLFNNKLLKKS